MYKLLVVDDEPSMLMGLQDNLEIEGYDVDTAENGTQALAKLKETTYDLVLLDVMMPEMSGFEVCKKARRNNINTPIVFLTAKGEEIDKVLGLELGADDYITKPFSLRELFARIKAILRRIDKEPKKQENTINEVEIGNLKVNFDSYSAQIKGEEIQMTNKEFEILKFLLKRENKIVRREDLLDTIWGDDYQPTARTIDNFILKLRKKVEDNPNAPKHIITMHGVGYRLILS